MNLSETVKSLSRELHISLTELSKRSGQSPQNLSKKLNKETLSYEEFERLLEVMGVKLETNLVLPGEDGARLLGGDERLKDQMKILEKLLEVERLKNKYFQEISYDFRTNLDTISGGINVALNHSGEKERVEECIKKLMPAISSLTRLIEDSPFNRENHLVAENDTIWENSIGASDFAAKRVLLVDDNDLNREIVKEILEDSGLETEEASNGKTALEMVKASKGGYFDFVLMDIQMPVMNGFDATKAIRGLEDDEKASTPIIAMTASVSEDDRNKAQEAGMNGFAEKPLNLQKLFSIMKEI